MSESPTTSELALASRQGKRIEWWDADAQTWAQDPADCEPDWARFVLVYGDLPQPGYRIEDVS